MSTKHRTPRGTTMNRRHLLRTAGVGAAGALALGAAGRGARSSVNAAPSRQDRTTVTFWTPGGSPIFCETHTEIAADYGTVNPNVTVNFQCGTDDDTYADRLLGAIAAGNPPDGTVLWDTPVAYGVRGALRPIDDLMATSQYAKVENWPASVLGSCQFKGQTFGLPVAAPTYGLWYNQDLFAEKGIPLDRGSFPKTWDELRRLSQEFTRWDGDRLDVGGFVLPASDLPHTLPIWSALNGGVIYDAANQRYAIDSEQNLEMMDYFLRWLDEEYRGDINAVERSGAWAGYPSDEGQPPEFQTGGLAVMEWGSWGLGDLYAYGETTIQQWDVAPYPVGPSGSTAVSGYWPNWLVIPDRAAHPEEAFGYLDYLSGVGIVKWFSAVPDMPTNALVPEVVPAGIVERRGEAFATDVMAFFRAQLQVATPMWDSPVQSLANDQIDRAIERILTKEAPPREALAEAQQACQTELENVLRAAS